MLGEIIENVLMNEPDMEVVGHLPDRTGLMTATGRAQADVVVLGLGDHEDVTLPATCGRMLAAYPRTRILGVASQGGEAFWYELRPELRPVGEISPDSLVTAIRDSNLDFTLDPSEDGPDAMRTP